MPKNNSTELEFTGKVVIKSKNGKRKKKKGGKRKVEDVLKITPENVEIYDTSPETHPNLFLKFEDEFISRRVVVAKGWKIIHPSKNPLSNTLLSEVIKAFMEDPLTYMDLMWLVDGMKDPYTCFVAKRIWWMMIYNEFIRYSLVKKRIDKGKEEAYMLVQHWSDYPIINFVRMERMKFQNIKED